MDTQIWDKHNISYFPTITSLAPPCIANFYNKRMMVFTGSEGGYFLIDETVTLDMVQSRWNRWVSPESKGKQKLVDEGIKTWKIPGSKGNEYDVTLRNGEFSCGCVGFGFRRKCKHVEAAKKTLTIS